MKKIIICLSIIFIANTTNAQTTITDTTQYLRDSIQALKSTFSNKSFSFFHDKLQLGIKYHSIDIPIIPKPDTLRISRITLNFNTISEIVTRELQHKKNPGIEIIFTSPILIPKAYLQEGGLLDWTTDWNSAKANFFANQVINEINVYGL